MPRSTSSCWRRVMKWRGGNIKNIAVAAAFLAADDGQVVRMNHVIQATLREYQKTGKLLVEDDEFSATVRFVRRPRG